MAKFEVKVRMTKVLEKPMSIFAKNEEEAQEKAASIVQRWDGVEEAEGFDAVMVEASNAK